MIKMQNDIYSLSKTGFLSRKTVFTLDIGDPSQNNHHQIFLPLRDGEKKKKRSTAQMKEQIKTPEKKLNKMERSNPSDAEFKTLVILMLKEPTEDFNSIKEIQSEMKNTLSEITIYRETTVERMKQRIKSMIWKIRKQKPTT